MFGLVAAGNQDVIQVDESARYILEHMVHEPLEHLGTVLHAERHPEIFEQAEPGDDGRLPDVLGVHRDLMISPLEIQTRENGTAMKIRSEVLNVRQRVPVVLRTFIQTAKVAAGSP